jgi:hypothetical protein
MSAQKAALVTKPILGTALFALGTAVVLTRLVFFLTNSETDVLGALPAFGMALLRASTTLPFSGHGLFAVVLGVLVSFWPLLLIAVGGALLIRSEVTKSRRATVRG